MRLHGCAFLLIFVIQFCAAASYDSCSWFVVSPFSHLFSFLPWSHQQWPQFSFWAPIYCSGKVLCFKVQLLAVTVSLPCNVWRTPLTPKIVNGLKCGQYPQQFCFPGGRSGQWTAANHSVLGAWYHHHTKTAASPKQQKPKLVSQNQSPIFLLNAKASSDCIFNVTHFH